MRYRIDIAFKGTNYSGWQIQPNAITVQEELNKALTVLLKHKIESTGCGRTDSGVHAKRFVAHFDCAFAVPEDIHRNLNAVLPKDISVFSLVPVNDDFHARYSAKNRTYEYRIYFFKNPFLEGFATYLGYRPDIKLLNEAAGIIQGERDFQCFSKVQTDVVNFRCNVSLANWKDETEMFIFTIQSNRFLRNMVRAIVGTCLLFAEGKIDRNVLMDIMESGDRRKAGASVPAEGLYLTDIDY